MPVVTVTESGSADSIYNDPKLTARVRSAVTGSLGAANVLSVEPVMASEDFSHYGRTVEHVLICDFLVGASDPAKLTESRRTGMPLPALHSSKFAPDAEPMIRTGIAAMTAATLDLLPK